MKTASSAKMEENGDQCEETIKQKSKAEKKEEKLWTTGSTL